MVQWSYSPHCISTIGEFRKIGRINTHLNGLSRAGPSDYPQPDGQPEQNNNLPLDPKKQIKLTPMRKIGTGCISVWREGGTGGFYEVLILTHQRCFFDLF